MVGSCYRERPSDPFLSWLMMFKGFTFIIFLLYSETFAIYVSQVKLTRKELREGEGCELGNERGLCMRLKACADNVMMIKHEEQSTLTCGYTRGKKKSKLYCCPLSPQKAQKACQDYKQITSSETTADTYISHGTLAKMGEFPHMVALWYHKTSGTGSDSTHWRCGATLISNNFILTAAHCVDLVEDRPAKIRLGDIDLKEPLDDGAVQEYNISRIFIHPGYKPLKYIYNDIALIRTRDKVKFNSFVFPACVNDIHRFDDKYFSITGWGQIELNRGGITKTSQPLRKALVRSLDSKLCADEYVNYDPVSYFLKLRNGIVNSQICAIALKNRRSSTCQGDSGGPLQYKEDKVFYIAGITSLGAPCGGATPGVYTRVSEYLPWIEYTAWLR